MLTISIEKITDNKFRIVLRTKGQIVDERVVNTKQPYEVVEKLVAITKLNPQCQAAIA